MSSLIQVRPRYRLAYCPREEADRGSLLPADVTRQFSPAELSDIASLAQRRRRDRIAGRLAAKKALRAHFRDEHGWDLDETDLTIGNDVEGRPVLRLAPGVAAPIPSFSLSHGQDGAVCAVAATGRLVGVDLETIVPRPAAVMEFVASQREAAAAPPSDPNAQARLWTGKEATLKLLGLGLDADARGVVFDGEEIFLSGLPERAWKARGAPRMRIAYENIGASLIAVAFTGD